MDKNNSIRLIFRNKKGFTLVEVILVVVVLCTLALVILPRYASYDDEQKLIGAATELADMLQYAASEAKRTNVLQRVEIDPATESSQLFEDSTDAIIYHPGDKKPYRLSFDTLSSYSGVDLASVNGSTVMVPIIFNSNGTPDSLQAIIMTYAGHSRTITVNNHTGRVSVD